MPLYGVSQAGSNQGTPTVTAGQGQAGQPGGFNVVSLSSGDLYTMFASTDSLSAPQSSVAITLSPTSDGSSRSLTFNFQFVSAPTASVVVQVANQDVDSYYVTVYTSTNLQSDVYTDDGASRFYRVKLISQSAGGALVATVQRA